MRKVYTEREALADVAKNLHLLKNDLSEGLLDFADIKRIVPCYVHLNSSDDAAIKYVDLDVIKYFPISQEDVQKDGMDALTKICHPSDLVKVTGSVANFFSNRDTWDSLSIIERLKNRGAPADEFNLYFTVFRSFNESQCLGITVPVSNVNNIANRLNELLDEHDFLKKNFERFTLLTKQEKKILQLLATGSNNPEISEKLSISRRTVENHRKSINKKLEIKNFAHLMRFAKAFNLV